MHKEVEGPVVDVVGNWSAESLGRLAAEHDVEASFLAWWDHLREWATLLEFRVLVDQKPHIDVLPEVIADDEALGSRGLDEDGLEIDLLWTSIYLLQLLSSELDATVPDLCLCLWLSLPLSFHDPVLVCFSSVAKASEVRLGGLVAVDRLLDVKQVDLCWYLELSYPLWRRKSSVHSEVRVLLNLLQCLWWQSVGGLVPLLDPLIPVPVQALPPQELVRLLLVLVNLCILFNGGHVARSERGLYPV